MSLGSSPGLSRLASSAARTALWAVCVALGALWVAPSHAHMFYLEPRLVTDAGSPRLLVDVKVGHPFDAEVLPRMAHHVDRFVSLDGSGGASAIAGVDGRAPAGVTTWTGGARLLSYRSRAVAHRMKRAAFLRYGEEEGLSHLIASQPESSSGTESESYHRCAKALTGATLDSSQGQDLASQSVECALDLVALDGAGTYRVLFRGEPIPFVQVRLSGDAGQELTARSNAEGAVEFRPGPGRWILSAVHLEPMGRGEWRSWWASFVFDVEGAGRSNSAARERVAG